MSNFVYWDIFLNFIFKNVLKTLLIINSATELFLKSIRAKIMSKPISNDLIRKYCGGLGKRFANIVCNFYLMATSNCTLLENEKLEKVFLIGRCKPGNFLHQTVYKILLKYKFLIEPKDYIKSVSFIVFEHLRDLHLKHGFNFAVLIGIIRKAAYNEVVMMLLKEGYLVRKLCGNCLFLSDSKPYFCQNISFENKKNPFYFQKRKRTDKACEGFQNRQSHINGNNNEPISNSEKISTVLETIEDNGTTKEIQNMLEINMIKAALLKRIQSVKQTNTKKIFIRQFRVFESLYNCFSRGLSENEAKHLIAESENKNFKTIDRDIEEIRVFLSK